MRHAGTGFLGWCASDVNPLMWIAELDANGAFEDFDGGAADPGDQLLFVLGNFDFDVARAPHLFALQDAEGLPWRELAVLDQVGAERTRS